MKQLITILLLLGMTGLQAQETLPINLEKVLELGGANNLTIQEYKDHQELAEANMAKAKEWWLPNVYGGLHVHQLWGAVMNGNGNFFLDVNRNNLWGGLGVNASWDFAEGIYKTKASELKIKAAQYRTEAERNKALYEIIDAYYDFMAEKLSYQAYQQLLAQADNISHQIDIQVEAGLRFQSELLLSKSSLNHLKVQMLKIKTAFNRKSANLIRLLNLDPSLKLVSIDSVLTPLYIITENTAIQQGAIYVNRPEYKESEALLQASKIEEKMVTTGHLFPKLQLNTSGAYFGGLNGPVSPMVPAEYPETNQLYPTGVFNIALMWQIPIGRLISKGEEKQFKARTHIQQTRIEQVKSEISEEILIAQQAISIAKEQIEIAFEGNQLAEEALRQSIQRQELGTARPFEILQAQEIFIEARLDYLKAVVAFNKAQYALKVAKGERL